MATKMAEFVEFDIGVGNGRVALIVFSRSCFLDTSSIYLGYTDDFQKERFTC